MKNLITLFLFLFFSIQVSAQSLSVMSPGAVNEIKFQLIEGVPYYSVERLGGVVIETSRLGFEFRNISDLKHHFRIKNHSYHVENSVWEQVWGEKQFIRDQYHELKIELIEDNGAARLMNLYFRAYDDGIGFRYEIPEQEKISYVEILDELTEFRFPENHEAWYINAYQWNRFEYLTEEATISDIDTVHTPLTMRTKDGLYLSLHEAALSRYSTMTLERTSGNTLKANLIPWADGVLVRTETPMLTPWRTVQLADNPGDLITSYLILNLNEPNTLESTSWIEPSKYIGIWWEMHLDKSTWGIGPKHGATTENTKRYVDFAAAHGFSHVLVEGWNVGWDENWFEEGAVFDFVESAPGFDLAEIAVYAAERNVRIMGHHENSASVLHYEGQMEASFAQYAGLGVRAVKTGYVGHGREIIWYDEAGNTMREWHHGQFMVEHHQRVVELAARYEISLNVHEGLKDTGLRRTWPNLMTREVARGQEYNAWGENGGNPPNHVTYLPFTRLLGGPFDYTPGILQLTFPEYRPDNRINHTLAKELALYVVIYSPLQMAADLPENYIKYPEAFQFILDVPTDWYDTRVLHADIGNYITVVRKERDSEDWYLGSISDENGRVLNTSLGFLDAGRDYKAIIYRDGITADWKSNPFELEVEEKIVTSESIIALRLGPGGGQAIRFIPVD